MLQIKNQLMDESGIRRSLMRITHEILERYKGADDLVLVGIRRRGIPLANMLSDNIEKVEGTKIPVGHVDITHYRDDINDTDQAPVVSNGEMPIDITGKTVVLVDDVMSTGRTARAAIEALLSFGRPQIIGLAVLVDRGHRELPLRPDFIGKNIPTSKQEVVCVKVPEIDGELAVYLADRVD